MMLAMRLLTCPIDVGQGHALFPSHDAKGSLLCEVVIFSLGILGFELLICQDNRADRGESGHKRLLLLQN